MVNGVNNVAGVGKLPGVGGAQSTGSGAAGGSSFADTLRGHIDEVSKLQREASEAVQKLATNQTDDVAGGFSAMEKSDVAVKTLLAIRGKLMDAYDEIKNIPI